MYGGCVRSMLGHLVFLLFFTIAIPTFLLISIKNVFIIYLFIFSRQCHPTNENLATPGNFLVKNIQ